MSLNGSEKYFEWVENSPDLKADGTSRGRTFLEGMLLSIGILLRDLRDSEVASGSDNPTHMESQLPDWVLNSKLEAQVVSDRLAIVCRKLKKEANNLKRKHDNENSEGEPRQRKKLRTAEHKNEDTLRTKSSGSRTVNAKGGPAVKASGSRTRYRI
jgi:hypothetical protein